MENLKAFVARIKVLLGASVTYLVAASGVIVWLSPRIADIFPSSADTIATWSARAVGWLAGAVLIIRRVTPVPTADRGVLPADTTN